MTSASVPLMLASACSGSYLIASKSYLRFDGGSIESLLMCQPAQLDPNNSEMKKWKSTLWTEALTRADGDCDDVIGGDCDCDSCDDCDVIWTVKVDKDGGAAARISRCRGGR